MLFKKAQKTIGRHLPFGFTITSSMFALWCGLMVLLPFSCSQITDERKPEAGELLKNGNAYLDAGDYTQALNAFTNAIALDPLSAPAYRYRGNVYNYLGEFDKAIDDYTRAIGLNPDAALLAIVYHNRGALYVYQNKYEEAINDLTRSIESNPDFTELRASALLSRGQAYLGRDAYEEAIDDYTQAITLGEDLDAAILADGYFGLCMAHFSRHEYAAAIAALDEIIEISPDDAYLAYAYYDRGLMNDYLSAYDKAIADYTESITLNANTEILVWAYNNRGWVYIEKGDPYQAIADANSALALQPDKDTASFIYDTRGQAYYMNGAYEQAIADLTQSIDTFSGEDLFLAVRYYTRGSAYMGSADFSSGLADFDKAFELSQGYLNKNNRSLNRMAADMLTTGSYETLAAFLSDSIKERELDIGDLLAKIGELTDDETRLRLAIRIQAWQQVTAISTGLIRTIGDTFRSITNNVR
jgi:tetratricopeptide (TPR) repeat protein